ncbi:hypothetical protein FRB94_004025 [Tulasnella sp. JGI-2019a]|nr:hypothetical protein FRB93_003357 [Tulasnella sp. JGI-2019a]KAG9002282.1 hypothetical protein FRB94_004025 [Tulasnella sp. JGI-2019a]KAG9032836.1 hypothetical protein FRB95_000919 [Tulasnella sp. JGI-2019a]
MLPPRAYLFLSLNAVRILSIIALLLVFSSNILIMVEDIKAVKRGNSTLTSTDASGNIETFDCDYFVDSTVPNQPAGAFWAVVNRLFIIATTIMMILSEVGWPNKFFEDYLPILGRNFGVGILGGIQWITAASILSHHVDDFPLVAGFFLFVIGCFNILLGLVFRDSIKEKRSILSFRNAKAQEMLPTSVRVFGQEIRPLQTSKGSIFSNGNEKAGGLGRSNTGVTYKSTDEMGQKTASSRGVGTGYGFARQGEKRAAQNGFFVTRPLDSLPRYHPRPPTSVENESEDEDEPPQRPNRF